MSSVSQISLSLHQKGMTSCKLCEGARESYGLPDECEEDEDFKVGLASSFKNVNCLSYICVEVLCYNYAFSMLSNY